MYCSILLSTVGAVGATVNYSVSSNSAPFRTLSEVDQSFTSKHEYILRTGDELMTDLRSRVSEMRSCLKDMLSAIRHSLNPASKENNALYLEHLSNSARQFGCIVADRSQIACSSSAKIRKVYTLAYEVFVYFMVVRDYAVSEGLLNRSAIDAPGTQHFIDMKDSQKVKELQRFCKSIAEEAERLADILDSLPGDNHLESPKGFAARHIQNILSYSPTIEMLVQASTTLLQSSKTLGDNFIALTRIASEMMELTVADIQKPKRALLSVNSKLSSLRKEIYIEFRKLSDLHIKFERSHSVADGISGEPAADQLANEAQCEQLLSELTVGAPQPAPASKPSRKGARKLPSRRK
ncbi:hypothetical protein PAPHI01_1329 [Pancytospora philotis]|nr:hypothetical protein PAPHI01_1329 [Pancytospora philotis]